MAGDVHNRRRGGSPASVRLDYARKEIGHSPLASVKTLGEKERRGEEQNTLKVACRGQKENQARSKGPGLQEKNASGPRLVTAHKEGKNELLAPCTKLNPNYETETSARQGSRHHGFSLSERAEQGPQKFNGPASPRAGNWSPRKKEDKKRERHQHIKIKKILEYRG